MQAVSRRRKPIAFFNVLVLSVAVAVLVAVWVLVDLGGWSYYSTPLRIRGYAPGHVTLKPSGSVSHLIGVVGFGLLTMPFMYAARKRWTRLSSAGSITTWLEAHIFCGIVGPVLVTFHTAFKFNGVISVAYWSMMLVMLSGFVGRYLYVRIPKSIRGAELTRAEIEMRMAILTAHLAEIGLNPVLRTRVGAESVGGWWSRRRLRLALVAGGVARNPAIDVVETLAERGALDRRLAYLERTKKLFAAWHVFHQPLVYVMIIIALLHVGVALYLGYSLF
jgi:hypothetical protein